MNTLRPSWSLLLTVALLAAGGAARAEQPTVGGDDSAWTSVVEPALDERLLATMTPTDREVLMSLTVEQVGALLAGADPGGIVTSTGERLDRVVGRSHDGLAADLVYAAVPPCRIVDTRLAGGILAAGITRTFQVRGPSTSYSSQGGNAAGCGIPGFEGAVMLENAAKAVMLNFVAVGPGGAGHLTAWPANQPLPTASVINYDSGNVANGVIVPMCDEVAVAPCASGDVSVRAAVADTHVVIDVLGYFHAGRFVRRAGDTMTGELITTRLKAGAPSSLLCSTGGDVCADDDVVADDDVIGTNSVLGVNFVQGGYVKTSGTVALACEAGDVCAAEQVFGDELRGTDLVRAGIVVPVACDGGGDVCAADEVVGNRVLAGNPSNAACGPSTVCADLDLVADGRVIAGTAPVGCTGSGEVCGGGDFVQAVTGNGLVKAGVLFYCDNTGSAITRSFYTNSAAAITIANGGGDGECSLTFPASIASRYAVATAADTAARGVSVEISGSTITVQRWGTGGGGQAGDVFLLLY